MRKHLSALGLFLGMTMTLTLSCGGGNGFVQQGLQPATGSLTLLGGDAPLCNVISFKVTITGATLTPQSSGSAVSVISSASPVTVDFAALMDFETVLNLASVPTGTYSTVTFTFSNPQLIVLDTNQTPPAPVAISTTMSPLTVALNLSSPLTISSTAPTTLGLELNLLKSVQTNPSGQVTGVVNPAIQVQSPSLSVQNSLGELDDLSGIVQSTSASSSNSSFTGSFTIPKMPGSGQLLTINITSSTLFKNISDVTGLVGRKSFVEVDAFLDANSNIVAKEVVAEAQEDQSQGKTAFVGFITSVTRDSSGNTTQANLFVRAEAPDFSTLVPLGSSQVIQITSSTQFNVTADTVNQGNIVLTASSLGPGQSVVVHGQVQAGSPPTVTANSIFLRLQSIVGNFSANPPPVIGSDGKTGGFTLVPCSALYGGAPMTIFTFATTDFPGVTGGNLSGLTSNSLLVAKGITFFEPNPLSVNGMAAATPGIVGEAKSLHQLP